MAEPVLSMSDPADGDTDVFVNNPLDATFDSAIQEASVSSTTVLLTDVGANELVSISVELISTTVIRISPIGVLAEDTLYKLSFPGTDIALSSNYVIKDDASGDPLLTALSITFRVGSRTYIDDTKIDKNAADLSLEGDLNLPVHVKALGDLALGAVTPKNSSYDIATGSYIRVQFTRGLSGDLFSQTWLDVNVYAMLDSEYFLASDDTLGQGSLPGSSLTWTGVSDAGDAIDIHFDANLPQNACVEFSIDESVQDIDGNEYGPNSYVYHSTTDRYPSISGVHSIKRELKAISDELSDAYIAASLLSSTIRFAEKFPSGDVTSHLALRWVNARTIVDILDDKELEKAIVAGTRRQLGDFNVSVDPIVGALALKHKRALDELDGIAKSINRSIAMSYSLESQGGIQRSNRLWNGVNHRLVAAKFAYYQPNIPASNLGINRAAKVPPSTYYL